MKWGPQCTGAGTLLIQVRVPQALLAEIRRACVYLQWGWAFEDGSYVSRTYPSSKDRERDRNGLAVRVIEYVREHEMGSVTTPENDDRYRLITTIFDPEWAPAADLPLKELPSEC